MKQIASEPAGAEDTQKLQKIIATSGRGSRRQIEQWIAAGRVEVNGKVAHLGQRAGAEDKITIDGVPIVSSSGQTAQVLVLNKAGGLVCSRKDPEGRPSVFDQLPKLGDGRWISVGRLDIQTTGLLLLTNDGTLAHRMMHPSTGLDREYAVRIDMKLEDDVVRRLTTGIDVDGETMKFSDVRYYNGSESNFWYHVVLLEGRNREVRRLFEAVGARVSRLKRVRYGPVVLPSWLTVGHWASLQGQDLKDLYKMLRMPRPNMSTQRLRRSKVAKTTCLIPYPKLQGLAEQKPSGDSATTRSSRSESRSGSRSEPRSGSRSESRSGSRAESRSSKDRGRSGSALAKRGGDRRKRGSNPKR